MTPLIKDILDYSLNIRILQGLEASQPFTKTETSLSEPFLVNHGGRHLTRQGLIKLSLKDHSRLRKHPGPEGLRMNKEAALEIPSGYVMQIFSKGRKAKALRTEFLRSLDFQS